MSHDMTIRDLERLLEDLDREMDKMRVVLRHGGAIREEIRSALSDLRAAVARNDP